MSWWKADDRLFDNPKVVAVRAHAKLLYVVGIAYCAGGLTDGAIGAAALPVLCGKAGLAVREGRPLAAELVAAGLWEAVDGGYVVHDYLAYNPSRATVLAARARDLARKPPARANGFRADSTRIPDGFRMDSRPSRARELPYPSLTPVHNSPEETPVTPPATDYEQVVVATSREEGAAAAAGGTAVPRSWDAAETEVAVSVWERAAPVVRDRLHARNWATYLDGAQPLGVRDGELVLRVRSPALLDQAGKFVDLIADSLRGLDGDAPHHVRLVASSA